MTCRLTNRLLLLFSGASADSALRLMNPQLMSDQEVGGDDHDDDNDDGVKMLLVFDFLWFRFFYFSRTLKCQQMRLDSGDRNIAEVK